MTNVGEAGLMPVKVGITAKITQVTTSDNTQNIILHITATIENYSNIPMGIGVESKFVVDENGANFSAHRGTQGVLNPQQSDVFDYTFHIPKDSAAGPLHLAFISYKDSLQKSQGFVTKWKVQIL